MRHGFLASAVAVGLVCAASGAHAQIGKDAVGRLAAPIIEAEMAPGVSVSVYRNGEARHFGFGTLTFDGGETPDEHTLYEIGSITKVFTGVLLADAVRRGEAKLDDPLSEHLPDGVRAPKRDGEEITLAQLASHTSSLPRLPSNMNPAGGDPYAAYDAEQLWAFVSDCRPMRAPGSEYEYSNLGAGLLGQILADAAGTDYESLVLERICEPLGMGDTRIELGGEQAKKLAPGHSEGREVGAWHFDALAGCGALRSTSADLLVFVRASMRPPGAGIGESLALAERPRFTSPDGQRIALGWHIARDGATYWHNGGTGGYSSYAAFNRPLDTAVVVLANGSVPQVAQVGEQVLLALAGMDVEPIDFGETADVAPEKLERLVGEYKSSMGFSIYVTREDGRLYARVTGQTALRVYPESPTLFKYRAVEAEIEFELGEDAASALTLFQNGMEIRCERVE